MALACSFVSSKNESPCLEATWRGAVSEGVDEVARCYVEATEREEGSGSNDSVVGIEDSSMPGREQRRKRVEGLLISEAAILPRFSRKPTAVQWGKVKEKTRCVSWRIFLMRFRAGLPLRAKGCAIPTTEQRPSRDFRIRKNFVLSGEKSQGRSREGGIEGAEVLTLEKRSREGIEKLYNNFDSRGTDLSAIFNISSD